MPHKSKPKPSHILPKAEYPKLSDYVLERRGFLKNLFFGALSAGVGNGLLAGCAESYSARRRNDDLGNAGSIDSYPDNMDRGNAGSIDSYPDNMDRPDSQVIELDTPIASADAAPVEIPPRKYTPDASDPDPNAAPRDAAPQGDAANPVDPPPVDPDWQVAGGMVAPQYYTVVLPVSGTRFTYLGVDEELEFSISFITYNSDLAAFFQQNENNALGLINSAFSRYTCATLNLSTIDLEIKSVFEAQYRQQSGDSYATIESLSLTIHSCRSMPMGGEPPASGY